MAAATNVYSVEAYVTAQRRANAAETLQNLLSYLLAYGDSAKAHFSR